MGLMFEHEKNAPASLLLDEQGRSCLKKDRLDFIEVVKKVGVKKAIELTGIGSKKYNNWANSALFKAAIREAIKPKLITDSRTEPIISAVCQALKLNRQELPIGKCDTYMLGIHLSVNLIRKRVQINGKPMTYREIGMLLGRKTGAAWASDLVCSDLLKVDNRIKSLYAQITDFLDKNQ